MGEIEERLKGMGDKPAEKLMVKSELERALEEEETELARELRTGRAEEVIAKRRVRIDQLSNQLGKGGAAMTEEERQDLEMKEKAERIEQAKGLYNSCIEAGGDPTRCAQMVAGLIPSPTGMVAPQATSIIDLVNALKTLDELRGSDKGLGDLKQSFENLAKEIRDGNANRQILDPVSFAKQQAEGIRATYEAMKEIGIIKEPVVTAAEGKSLEVVKEENRHVEKMKDLETDSEWKRETVKTLSELPERIGRGIASQVGEGDAEGDASGSLKSIECGECGHKIQITPETESITCGKCGTIYSKGETVKAE